MKMMMRIGMAVWCATGAWAGSPDLVARVMSGELKEARASWWGFDPADSTRALQAAIKSRVPRLIVDNVGAPWIATTVWGVSDQEIVFEPGVEVLAKKGEFLDRHASLFRFFDVTNVTLRGYGATLRMRRADYAAPPYAPAEWRTVLELRGASAFSILGLTLAESGGDGIYLGVGAKGAICRDIVVKDVVCDRNYRQGISVVCAENLLIENTVMRGTAGTMPQAGIDFEPNNSWEPLKNIVMRNCLSLENKGNGFFIYLIKHTRESEPVSFRFENCRSVRDGRAATRVVNGNAPEACARGSIVFSGCRFEESGRPGVNVASNPEFGLAVTFEDCTVENCAGGTNGLPDILLENESRGEEHPVGGVRFDRVTVISPFARPWIAWENRTLIDPVASVAGSVTVEQPGVPRREIVLTPDWVRATFPRRFPVRVPRAAVDLSKARVVNRIEGVRDFPPLRLRFGGAFRLHATAGQEAILVGEHTPVDGAEAATNAARVIGPSGKVIAEQPMPPFGKRTEFRFQAPETGFYTLEANAGKNAFALVAANVPVAIDVTRQAALFYSSEGSLFVPVPKGTGAFAFAASGGWEGEAVKFTVTEPDGKVAWTKDNIVPIDGFTAMDGQGARGGLWELKFEKPGADGFKNYYVDVRGVPGFLFPSRERYWEF